MTMGVVYGIILFVAGIIVAVSGAGVVGGIISGVGIALAFIGAGVDL